MADAPAAPAPSRATMKKELPEHFRSYKHVWVNIELERGQVHPVSFELLGEGRKLADKLGVELAGVLVGARHDAMQEAAVEAWEHGADLAYLVADPILEHYRNEPFSQVLTELVNTYKPEVLLLGATVLGRDLAGSVATTLLTGLTADCTELEIDDDIMCGQIPELVREFRQPMKPSPAEVKAHQVLHEPYASWCEECVAPGG